MAQSYSTYNRRSKHFNATSHRTNHFLVVRPAMDAAAMQQQGERREAPRLERKWTAAYDFRVAQTQKARELCRRGPCLAVLAVVAISEAAQPRAQPAGRELCSKRQIRIPCQARFAEAPYVAFTSMAAPSEPQAN